MLEISKSGLFVWAVKKLEEANSGWINHFEDNGSGITEIINNSYSLVDKSRVPNKKNQLKSKPVELLFLNHRSDLELIDDMNNYIILSGMLESQEYREVNSGKYMPLDYDDSLHLEYRKLLKSKLDKIYNKYSNDLSHDDFKYISENSDLSEVSLIDLLLSTNLKNTDLVKIDEYLKYSPQRKKYYTIDNKKLITNSKRSRSFYYASETKLHTEVLVSAIGFPEGSLKKITSKYRNSKLLNTFKELFLAKLKSLKLYYQNTKITKEIESEMEEGAFTFKELIEESFLFMKMGYVEDISRGLGISSEDKDKYIEELLKDYRWSNFNSARVFRALLSRNMNSNSLQIALRLDKILTKYPYTGGLDTIPVLDPLGFNKEPSVNTPDDALAQIYMEFIDSVESYRDNLILKTDSETSGYFDGDLFSIFEISNYKSLTNIIKDIYTGVTKLDEEGKDKLKLEYGHKVTGDSINPWVTNFNKYVLETEGDPKKIKNIILKGAL